MKSFFQILTSAFILFFITGMFTSCGGGGSRSAKPGDLHGKITISGAFALYPMTLKWADEFKKIHPGITFNISAGGAGKGMADALSHMVDLGMFSKEVSPEEKAKGAWFIPVAKDAVLPTVNANNPVIADLRKQGLSHQAFYDIFITGKITTWGQATHTKSSEDLQALTRSDACGAAEMWAKYLDKKKKQEDLIGLGVNGDPGIADAVRKNVNAIGFNNLNFAYDMNTRKPYAGMAIVPIDLNGNGKIDPDENFYDTMDHVMKAILDGRYPSPPARDLYLVAGGEPKDPNVRAFLKWILGDGQKFVNDAGYITIAKEKLDEGLERLK
ncbi:MAG: PstS family phosphate ABC transporter substrate-binding protein [Bacteroidota bacterium]|nr:PstS family phosphate ABC transporter substrate-binding protein [Bacteroidota bacterium]